jgi:hypothetical protein
MLARNWFSPARRGPGWLRGLALPGLLILLIFTACSAVFIFTGRADRPALFKPVQASASFQLTLNEGWNLVSIPLWAVQIKINEDDIEACLTYREGRWLPLESEGSLYEELNNPAGAVFIKARQSTNVVFSWAVESPDRQFAWQQLTPGWNLVSSGLPVDALTILAGVYAGDAGGVSHIVGPNRENGRKEAGYHLPWPSGAISLSDQALAASHKIYPFDGYWVYLQGNPLVYSTPVGSEVPARVGN